MQETSRLAVVVDTSRAEIKIKSFNNDLKQMELLGTAATQAVSRIGSTLNLNTAQRTIRDTEAALKTFSNTSRSTISAINKLSQSARNLRSATQGIATNLSAISGAMGGFGRINANMNTARNAALRFSGATTAINTNLLILNTTLNASAASFGRFNAAANNASQRLDVFGRASTQSQTRLRGLDAGLAAARTNMAAMATATNNLNAFMLNLNAQMGRLTTATNQLNAATARANAAQRNLGGDLSRTNTQARGLMGTLTSLQGVITGSLAGLAGFNVLKTADAMQNLNSQIKIVTNSEEEYLLVRQKVRELADENYSSIEATTELYTNSARALANLGKSQADAVAFTDAVSLAMRTGGKSAQEQASAIMQLGQAMGANVVQGDEFRSIAENAPILLELVAKRLDVLPGQLKKMAAEGVITGEVMFDALTQNVDMLEQMAEQMPLTMSQAFTVSKNRYKTFVDGMMNETGGLSSSIAGMISNISANFDVLAKVAIAGAGLAFLSFATNVGTATKAMALFNAVASANPLVLVAGGFLAVTSAIYGTEEVLDTTGTMIKDLMTLMNDMALDTRSNFEELTISIGNSSISIGDLIDKTKSKWYEYQLAVAQVTGRTDIVIAQHNANSVRSYFGFFKETERGFAGLVQKILGNILSVSALTETTIRTMTNWIDNLAIMMENLGRVAVNAGNSVRSLFGLASKQVDYMPMRDVNPISIYKDINTSNQNAAQSYAKKLNRDRYGAAPIIGKDGKLIMGFADLRAGANSVLKTGGAPSIYQPRPQAQLSTAPMSAEKAMQKIMLDQQLALEENTKALEKAEKERAKASKGSSGKVDSSKYIQYANSGASRNLKLDNELVDRLSFLADAGIVFRVTSGGQGAGSKGRVGSTAHNGGRAGDGDLYKDGRKLNWHNPKDLTILKAVVEEAASRGINGIGAGDDYMGAGRFHFGIQKNSAAWGKGGKGANALPWVKESLNKGLARKQDSSFLGKYEDRENKALEMAIKKQEEMRELQLKITSEYGTKQEQLELEHDKRMEEIRKSGFDGARQEQLEQQSIARMNSELEIYREGFNRQLEDLSAFQRTKQYMLEKARDDEIFDAEHNKDLMRPENKEQLEAVKKAIENKYEFEIAQNSAMLQQQRSELYSFDRTERQLVEDSWDFKISEARFYYDELSAERLEAYQRQKQKELDLFDVTESIKMLELKKNHMTEIAYINEKYALDKELIALNNASPESKAAQYSNLDSTAMSAADDVRKRVGGNYEGLLQNLYGQNTEGTALRSSWEAQRNILKEAYDEGVIQKAEYYETLEDLDRDYQNKQQAIVVGGYQTAFGAASSLLKAFGLEKSAAYRAMFVVEKVFALKRVFLENQVALSKAWASAAFPYNLPAYGSAMIKTGVFTAALSAINPQGFKAGGYTGNGSPNDIAGPVHKREYVFDAQATKAIGVKNLDKLRKGEGIGGGDVYNINTTVSVDGTVNTQADQNNTQAANFAKSLESAIQSVIMKEKRQGGMLSGA